MRRASSLRVRARGTRSKAELAEADAGRAEAALKAGEERRTEFEREADELEREVTHLDAERGKQELERTRLTSRVDTLLDRERELEGLDAGARAVVEAAGGDEGPALSGALRGLVADHLRTRSR